jgi:molybdate transport repressor ModE-like protein
LLDPRRVRVLVEVARRGSIAAAAESLSFVPSAVSQQIDALERELGVELTTRVGRGTVLTAAGRLLVERGEQLLRHLNEIEDALRDLNGLVAGRLRIAADPAVASTLAAQALGELARQHPGLGVALMERRRSESFEALRQRDADLAVFYSHEVLNYTPELWISQQKLLTDSLVAVVAPGHALADQRDVPIARLADEQWITDRPGTDGHLLTLLVCREAGFEPRIVHSASEPLVTLRLVSAGLGVALAPTLLVHYTAQEVAAVRLDSPPKTTVLAAWRDADKTQPVQAIVELLVKLGQAESGSLS